jgi:hypothetical protein
MTAWYEPWEDAILLEAVCLADCCARLPYRPYSSIRWRRKKLGLVVAAKPAQKWQQWEIEAIDRLRHDRPSLYAELPHRTPKAINRKIQILGLVSRTNPRWTVPAIRFLKAEANKRSTKEIAAELGRSISAVDHKVLLLKARPPSMNKKMGHRDPLASDVTRLARESRRPLRSLGFRYGRLSPGQVRRQGLPLTKLFQAVEALGAELYVEWLD